MRVFRSTAGFSMAELSVVLVVIGILTAVGLPEFLSYWQRATLRAGAEEVATVLNGARQLAITSNSTVCVTAATTTLQYHVGACGNATYVGPGTNAAGDIILATGVRVANNPLVTFTYLGGAGTNGVYTVTNPVNNTTQTVTVSVSGRITIP